MKTKQEIFNAVWQYFIVEGHPQAISENGQSCRYRGPKSNCAIGCQIPDELYNLEMESKNIRLVFDLFPPVKEFFGEKNVAFCSDLQCTHDFSFQYFRTRLTTIAQEHSLILPQ